MLRSHRRHEHSTIPRTRVAAAQESQHGCGFLSFQSIFALGAPAAARMGMLRVAGGEVTMNLGGAQLGIAA